MTSGSLYIVFGPSGAGKTSLVKALVEKEKSVVPSVSHTTRAKRPGEEHGVHYFFTDMEEFTRMQAQGEFVESARVFGNAYGTSAKELESRLQTGLNVVLEIDWQGAAQVREKIPHGISICILPPSRETLEFRLKSRAQDNEEIIQGRMSEARQEISHYKEADFVVINEDFETALAQLADITKVGCLITRYQQIQQKDLIAQLLA